MPNSQFVLLQAKCLLSAIFAFGLVLAPAAQEAFAQNLRKVERKLEDLVDRGHLMPRHADAMLETLHEMVDAEEHSWEERRHDEERDELHEREEQEYENDLLERREHLRERFREAKQEAGEIMKKVKQAFNNDDMTREELVEKKREIEEGVFHIHQELAKAEFELLEFRLKRAVEEGKISEEDARKKMETAHHELEEKFEGKGHARERDEADSKRQKREKIVAGLKKRLEIALDRGDITKEQAKERMKGLMRRFRQEDELKEAGKKLKKSVESGEMSDTDARAKFEEIRKAIERDSKNRQRQDRDGEQGN